MAESQPIGFTVETVDDVDKALEQRSRNALARASVLKRQDEAMRKIAAVSAEILKPIDAQDAAIDAALTVYLLRRRKSLLGRFGKTIRLGHGVVTWVVKARSVDTRKDVTDAINYLRSHPDGEKYLTRTTTLNKEALSASTDVNLLRALRRRGLRVSKHELLSVKPEGFTRPIALSRRLYPRRR